MADQIADPRLETLLRNVLAAEAAKVPLTTSPDQVLARRAARGGAGRRLWTIGGPVGGRRRLSASLGAVAVLAVLVTALRLNVAADRVTPPAALPTTPDAWSRVIIDAGPDGKSVRRLAASPNGLLAAVDVEDGPMELFASTDGHSWTQAPPDAHPVLGADGAGWALVGTDRGFLLSVDSGVWFSANGFDWQQLADSAEQPELRRGEMLSLAVGGPGYVAVGNGNNAWFSTDGSEWTLAEVPPPPTEFFKSRGYGAPDVAMHQVVVEGDTLVAFGTASFHTEDRGLTAPVNWVSTDGRTWANVPESLERAEEGPVAVGPGGVVGVDHDQGQVVVRTSADGRTWEQVADLGDWRSEASDGTERELSVESIAASQAGYVAVGGFGVPCLFTCGPSDVVLWTSPDGRSWSRLPSDERFGSAGAFNIVAWEDRFVVGGAQDSEPVIWISGPPPAGTGGAPGTSAAAATPAAAIAASTPAPSSMPPIQDIMALEPLGPIDPGTYFIDPDGDPATALRVEYAISAAGWSEWIGAAKFSDAGHSGVSITTVANLVTDGCHDHTWADPPAGRSVDDLVAAMTKLAPFEVTSPPSDVTAHGYTGKHLAWTVPDLPVENAGADTPFTDCDEGSLKSWVAFVDTAEPGDAFYGYTGPGYAEEFWILDVEGTRLMIAAGTSPGSPPADVAERDAILDSIVIKP